MLLVKFPRKSRHFANFSAVYAGLAVNFLVAHVGEFLRAATIARSHRVADSAVLASVVIERVLDFIALLVLLTVIVMAVPNRPRTLTTAAMVSGAVRRVLASWASYGLLTRQPGRYGSRTASAARLR